MKGKIPKLLPMKGEKRIESGLNLSTGGHGKIRCLECNKSKGKIDRERTDSGVIQVQKGRFPLIDWGKGEWFLCQHWGAKVQIRERIDDEEYQICRTYKKRETSYPESVGAGKHGLIDT